MGNMNAQMTRYSPLLGGCFMLAILLLSAGTACAGTVVTQCNDCHGMPPKDAPRKSNPHFRSYSSATPGSHQKHLPTASVASDCVVCHGTAVSATNHQNDAINMASSISGGAYGKGVFFNQTSIPFLNSIATCSNVSCHGDPYSASFVTTPVWGTAAGCAACHNGAGEFTVFGGGPATGSHTLHSGFTVNSVCQDCHAGAFFDNYSGVAHRNGTINVVNGYTANVTKHAAGSGYSTCSTATCHENPYGTVPATSPLWGAETVYHCAGCHNGAGAFVVNGAPSTGSHAIHMTAGASCNQCHPGASVALGGNSHKDGFIDVAYTYSAAPVPKHAPGTYTGSCSTSTCHGSASPVWGVNNAVDPCTKCHGTKTVTVTVANRHVVAPPSDAAATDTGKVSAIARTGAHQTHLQFFNGLSNQGTEDDRCNACHGALPASGSHANGSSIPVFQGLATTSTGGTFATSYSAGTCSVYCHNPAGTNGTLAATNIGTGTTPLWTNAGYIAEGPLKSDANCNQCHKSPNSSNVISATYNHSGLSIATLCAPCHEHEGGAGGTAGRQHMDGVKWGQGGAGGCISCHGYGVGTWATATAINPEGKGAHEKHIAYLTTKLFTITLAPTTDTYAGATTAWTNVCGICHGSTAANHANGTVNVVLSPTYFFGTVGSATYNGTPGVSSSVSAATAKTCSNISCHYFTTPLWSTY